MQKSFGYHSLFARQIRFLLKKMYQLYQNDCASERKFKYLKYFKNYSLKIIFNFINLDIFDWVTEKHVYFKVELILMQGQGGDLFLSLLFVQLANAKKNSKMWK